MRIRFDPVRAVEACYQRRASDRDWLSGILDALRPLNDARGGYGKTYDVSTPEGLRVEIFVEQGSCDLSGVGTEVSVAIGAEAFRQLHCPKPPVALLSTRMRMLPERSRQTILAALHRHDVGDVLAILAGDPGGCGLLVGLPLGRDSSPPPRVVHRLWQVAAHLVTAWRFRAPGARAALTPGDRRTEAVLDPRGAVAEARGEAKEGWARALLREAVRRLDRARGPLRHSDPDEALSLWEGLVEGTWSLIDWIDSDGRRFVLARRNPPGIEDPRALHARERIVAAHAAAGCSNKHIGYLLGIAPTTVASHLRAIEAKLHVGSRQELIRLLATTGTNPAPPEPTERAAPPLSGK